MHLENITQALVRGISGWISGIIIATLYTEGEEREIFIDTFMRWSFGLTLTVGGIIR